MDAGQESTSLVNLVEVGRRFQRSVNLGRDTGSPDALNGYVVTPAVRRALSQITDGLGDAAGDRAWSLVGPYGSGKSAFAVFLADLLSPSGSAGAAAARRLLTGTIPPELGRLSNLYLLSLGGNELTGPIPTALAQAANLEWLNLRSNAIERASLVRLGNMTNLRGLGLSDLGLTGPIPTWLENLTNLQDLNLSRNALSGPVPAWLGTLTDLHWLYLYANPLSGPLPQSLTQLSSLREFWIHFTRTCAPPDGEFQAWVATLEFRGAACGQPATGSFQDPTLTPGVTGVKVIHVLELRSLVDVVRRGCGLPGTEWTDPESRIFREFYREGTPVKAVHLTELRVALAEAYEACSMTPPTYPTQRSCRG